MDSKKDNHHLKLNEQTFFLLLIKFSEPGAATDSVPSPQSPAVSAPSEVWCILQGVSPCRVRVSHPPVSSVAPVAEFRQAERTKQVKRTQRIMQAVGESALPEVPVSLRNELVPVAEGCNVRRRQHKIIR